MSRLDNTAVFLLRPGKEEHEHECKQRLSAFNEIVFYTKRISAAVRQMEGAFGHAEMSSAACIRKHVWGKNKIHYCAMGVVW